MSGLQVFTPVWGPKHAILFQRACALSLSWPANQAALAGATWNIWTREKEFPLYAGVVAKFPSVNFRFHALTLKPDQVPDNIVFPALQSQIRTCLAEDARVLFALPDYIFGEGTVANLLQLGEQKHTCVAVAHPRVLPSALNYLEGGPRSNGQLITLAFQHPHQSWTDAEYGHPQQTTFSGGIMWRKLSANTWEVHHRLPAIYLAHLTEADAAYFNSQKSFNAWDHLWPSLIIPQQRQRYVGSSDAACVIEYTEAHLNVPSYIHDHKMETPDQYWGHNLHNYINRQTVPIFRGEPL